MNDISKLEKEVYDRITALQKDIDAIQQPRSDFALTHFVVGAHDMPGRQRMQAVLELQIKMFNIQRAQLDERKLLIERDRQVEIKGKWTTGKREKELAQIEIERIDTDLAELRLARLGAVREANCLLAILERLPKYSYEELQKEEAQYWKARLSRQALQDLKATGTIGQGNLDAIRQITGAKTGNLSLEELAALGVLHLTS